MLRSFPACSRWQTALLAGSRTETGPNETWRTSTTVYGQQSSRQKRPNIIMPMKTITNMVSTGFISQNVLDFRTGIPKQYQNCFTYTNKNMGNQPTKQTVDLDPNIMTTTLINSHHHIHAMLLLLTSFTKASESSHNQILFSKRNCLDPVFNTN